MDPLEPRISNFRDEEEDEADEKMFSYSSDEEALTTPNMETLSAKFGTFVHEDILVPKMNCSIWSNP